MLKRVATSDIELGMFIHKLEGSWFKHPFWKSRFLLTDPQALDTLRASDVETVVIDTGRGLDVPPRPRESTIDAPPARATPLRRVRQRAVAPLSLPTTNPNGSASTAREIGEARNCVTRASKVISRVFLEARLGRTIGVSDVAPMVDEIYASIQRNLHAFNGLLRCQRGSEYAYRHALGVSALMIALARQLKLSPLDMREAGMAGLLLDIGVGQLPVDLSALQGDYRSLEPAILKAHVKLGHDLLVKAGDMPPRVINTCLCHHERLDGSGYPHGIAGFEIDLFSRMAAICDTYDNLIAGGAGRPAMDPAESVRALAAMGPAIDRDVLRAFVDTVGVYPIGSFVRLRSERLAMVVDEDPSDPTLPTVRTFWSLILEKRIRSETIALARCYGEDEIVGIADISNLGIPDQAGLRTAILASFARKAGA